MATTDLGDTSTLPPYDATVDNVDGEANENGSSDRDGEERESWSGRVTFWLAAVGSAVGLGNLWRFPWQCAKWGGGAFIFAYFVALITLGMPLLTQELVLGQKHRSGDIEAFGRMNWRLRGIGLASVIGGFGIVTYYMMIIGVSTVFFFESFIVPLPYEGDGANSYWTDILQLTSGIEDSTGIISGKLYLATCLCWALTFFCIMKGVKTASWAVKITMPLPFLLLFILLIKAATLEGSWQGVKAYFDFSNWDELSSPGIWNAAIGQCFFSLSVCMGVMTAYGSYNPKRQDIATDEKVISFLDVAASLMSGFVVYSILGYLTVTDPLPDGESWYDQGGVGLVFAAFPVAISTFKGANFFGIIFYLTLMLLGIDSAFSIVEAISTVIADSDLNLYRLKWSRTKISAVLCIVGAFGSSLYTFDTGLYWLDLIDHYINEYGMIFLGICEAGACGWFYRYDLIEAKIGIISANLYRIGYFFSLLMACFLSFALATPEQQTASDPTYYFTGTMGANSWIVGFVVGIILWFITIGVAYLQRSDYAKQNLTIGETMWYILGWENVEVLRDFMNGNGIGDQAWDNSRHTIRGEGYAMIHHSTIAIWWGFFIKYWLPTVLTINLIGTMRADRWNPYGSYPWGYQVVGILVFSAMVIIVALVAMFPQYMTQAVDETGKFGNLDNAYKGDMEDDNDNNKEKQKLMDEVVVDTNKEKTMQEIYDQYDKDSKNNKKKEDIELQEADKPKEEQAVNDGDGYKETVVEEEEEAAEPLKEDDKVKEEEQEEDKDKAKDEEYVKVEDDKEKEKDKTETEDADKPKEEEEKPTEDKSGYAE